jgi:hypothetical protein
MIIHEFSDMTQYEVVEILAFDKRVGHALPHNETEKT